MRRIFVDTVAWIALINLSDSLHKQARDVMEGLRRDNARLVATYFVLLEVADALSEPSVRSFIDGLHKLSLLTILRADSTMIDKGWSLYSQSSDKDLGWTDCTSFCTMTDAGIVESFTSDRQFVQAGFSTLLASI